MEKRTNIPTSAIWGTKVGYSRAVRIGPLIEVSGTTAKSNPSYQLTTQEKSDIYLQTKLTLKVIEEAIGLAGGKLQDVIRTRMYVTNIRGWELVGRAHAEFFKDIQPATSMIEVSKFIDPELLVEIEATAWIQKS